MNDHCPSQSINLGQNETSQNTDWRYGGFDHTTPNEKPVYNK